MKTDTSEIEIEVPRDREGFRRVIYTTNAIESIQAQLRSVTKQRGAFPNEASLLKVLYLALMKAKERWTMPITDWPPL